MKQLLGKHKSIVWSLALLILTGFSLSLTYGIGKVGAPGFVISGLFIVSAILMLWTFCFMGNRFLNWVGPTQA